MSDTNRAGIRIELENGRYGPSFFCDQCGKRICEATEGNAYWKHPKRGNKSSLLFAHKVCSRALEQTKPGDWLTNDLDVFMAYLSIGLGMGEEKEWKKTMRRAADFAKLY